MPADIEIQIREYTESMVSMTRPSSLEEVRHGTVGVQVINDDRLPVLAPRAFSPGWGLVVAAAAVTAVLAAALIALFLNPGDELAPVGTADSTSPDPRTLTDSLGNEWSRVPLDEAVFGGAHVFDVTAGGPGLVAVGGFGGSEAQGGFVGNEDSVGAVWTSVDGVSWSRVPHNDAVFGEVEISDVTAGGPGLVAVGWSPEVDAGAWTSVDGLTWSLVPRESAPHFDDGPPSVTAGGPGLVAVGQAGADAAVWTSADGFAWSRVPHDDAVFGGRDEAGMTDVTAGGPGLVAVGADWIGNGGLDGDDGPGETVVWTSVDGLTWSRVPHDDAVFGRPRPVPAMASVTAGGPGLVAVGQGRVWTSVDGLAWNYESLSTGWSEVFSTDSGLVLIGSGAWTSVDGITWSRVSGFPGSSYPPGGMTDFGQGLVAIVNTDRGAEVWLVMPTTGG